MNPLECAGTNACRQLCEALRAQQVEVRTGPDGCDGPEMFTQRPDTTVVFAPAPAGEAIGNLPLVRALGTALFRTLQEQNRQTGPEAQAVSELTGTYRQAFSARETLWRNMLAAGRDGRRFTPTELSFYQERIAEAEEAARKRESYAAQQSIVRARAAFDHGTLTEQGLLFDDQMTEVADRLVGNLMDNKPTLLVGDKGIAKTRAALYAAGLVSAEPPILISGHGDMMSNELVGQLEIVQGDTNYKPGKLVQALLENRPVIFDEVNLADPGTAMRIQHILLLRPGETITLQENGGQEIVVPPGFCVLATANDDPIHYARRRELDSAFRDRFDKLKIRYPDSDDKQPLETIPRSTMRLALASAVDDQGELSPHTPVAAIETLARLARITQYLYTVPAVNVPQALRGSETHSVTSSEPLMTDCITPRALADTIRRCAGGNKPGMHLQGEIARLIAGLDQGGRTNNQRYAQHVLALLQR